MRKLFVIAFLFVCLPSYADITVSGESESKSYQEGAIDTEFRGPVIMGESSDQAHPLQLDSSKNLKVNISSPATLDTVIISPSSIGEGSNDVASAGTAEVLASSTPCKYVIIVGKSTNTGNIYVGGSNVDNTNGIPLLPLQSEKIEIDNLNKVYIDADTNSEGVTYTYAN